MSGKTKQVTFDLISSGQDSYSGQNAQKPGTSRKIQSWVIGDDGQLHREVAEPKYLPTLLTGPVVALGEYDRNNGDGTITRYYFAAARTDFIAGTKTCNLYQNVAGAWVAVAAVGTLADAPMVKTFQNLFHLVDGVSNWIFDGTTWIPTGFQLQSGTPQNTTALTFPDGTNGPVVGLTQGALAPVTISGNVTAKFYSPSANSNGTWGHTYPLTGPLVTATGSSFMFNPPQFGAGVDPNQHPIKWATLDTSGNITGYTTPYAADTPLSFDMAVIGALIIPAPGVYIVKIAHDDGMIWGISNGANKGLAPTASGPITDAWNHIQTSVNGYGSAGGGVFCGGNNLSGNRTDTYAINFPAADTYTIEIDFDSWQNEQQLIFNIGITGTTPGAPFPTPGAGTTGISADLGRYYWVTMADETAGRGTESDTSPRSAITGPLTNATVNVYPVGGHFSCTSGSTAVTIASDTTTGQPLSNGSGTQNLLSYIVGKTLYINGTKIGVIASFTTTGSLNYLSTITLVANSASAIASGYAVICDSRTTNWHLYASESDGSRIGQFLATVPVTQNLKTSPVADNSPFIDDVTSQFLPLYRPVRNDPPPPSRILEAHKTRLWRTRVSRPNFFNYTANEEVGSGNNGDPAECVPGADVNTLSDIVNEVSFPDQSQGIRAEISHADALYIFSEQQCYPLYGQSYDDFALSQVTAFSVGIAGRFAGKSTPHGLAFLTYDCKAFLYPTQSTIWSLTPQANATEALSEIGKPLRNVFGTIDKTKLDQVVSEFYFYGIRDWWVVGFPDNTGAYQAWVYEFNTKGWFQLQKGFASLAVFEVAVGQKVLMGGGADGYVYVIDDQNGIYTSAAALPVSTWRPALINFGGEGDAHIFKALEIETNSKALADDLAITFWLDPNNVDIPGAGQSLQLRPIIGANRYLATPQEGATCQRMLLEIKANSTIHGGVIRGIKLTADTIQGLPLKSGGGTNEGT